MYSNYWAQTVQLILHGESTDFRIIAVMIFKRGIVVLSVPLLLFARLTHTRKLSCGYLRPLDVIREFTSGYSPSQQALLEIIVDGILCLPPRPYILLSSDLVC